LVKVFPGFHVVTPTTTLGHCSVMPVLIQENDAIILDTFVHNSVRMASNLCKANGTFVILSRHNDFEHVRYLIYRLKKDGYKNIWYCADGIYSMHGDKLKIHELAQLLDEEENLYAYVDDAHGVSWTGKNGSGYVLNEYGLHPKMIIAVSFAKSFAACGGALIFPNKEWAQLIRMTGQTMIFSGPISPPILGALIGSVKIHLSDNIIIYQQEILDLIRYFRNKCKAIKLPLFTKDETPIQMIKIGDPQLTYLILEELSKKGIFTTSAVYPAVPPEDAGIRITLTRHLKKEDIDILIDEMQNIFVTKFKYLMTAEI
jgi:7-keto-8-aminopelargonate synthetase-like enzyme